MREQDTNAGSLQSRRLQTRRFKQHRFGAALRLDEALAAPVNHSRPLKRIQAALLRHQRYNPGTMCLAAPARVISIDDNTAVVDYQGVQTTARLDALSETVAPGDYLLVVVQGPAQVKASAIAGALQPGDLVATAGTGGQAAKAAMVSLGGIEIAVPGTVLGKALEPLKEGQGLIHIYVTLQ